MYHQNNNNQQHTEYPQLSENFSLYGQYNLSNQNQNADLTKAMGLHEIYPDLYSNLPSKVEKEKKANIYESNVKVKIFVLFCCCCFNVLLFLLFLLFGYFYCILYFF